MKKRNYFGILTLVLVALVTFYACEKDEDNVAVADDEQIVSAEEELLAENLYDDIFSEVEDAVEMNYSGTMLKSGTIAEGSTGCPVVTVDHPDTTHFPRTITIDFGETNCEAPNGRMKRGKIIVTLSAPRWQVGAQKTVTFENYYVEDYHIEGTKTFTFNGKNEEGHPSITSALTGGVITTPDGEQISREATHTREIIAGQSTRKRWDDEFLLSGSAQGVNSNGKAYTMEITTPLHTKAICRWITEGVKEMQVGENNIVLDYGDGSCDNVAIAIINGESKEITLKGRAMNRP